MKNKIKTILLHRHLIEILKGSAIVLVYRILAALVTVLLTIEITNRLGAEESGYYFFLVSFLLLLTSISSFGLYNSILKEVSILMGSCLKISNLVSRSTILIFFGTVLVVILISIYYYFGRIYGFTHYIVERHYQLIFISLFPFSLMFLFSSYFQAYKNFFLSMFAMNLGYQLVMLGFVVIFNIRTLENILLVFEISICFVVLVSFVYYFSKHKNKFYISNDRTFSYLLELSCPMMISHIVSQANNFSGQLLLSLYSSPSDISLFAVVARISIVLGFIFTAVIRVSAPKFAILYHQQRFDDLRYVIIVSNRILFLVSSFVVLLIILFGKHLLLLFGKEFVNAYIALIVVSVGQLVASIAGIAIFVLQMTGGEKVVRDSMILSTILSILVGVILIPAYGIIGAAIMTFVSLCSMNLLACYYVYKKLNINPLSIA